MKVASSTVFITDDGNVRLIEQVGSKVNILPSSISLKHLAELRDACNVILEAQNGRPEREDAVPARIATDEF